MNSSKSNGNPQKSIVCVVDNFLPKRSVEYYISDEKKLSEVEENYKETKWDFVKISGKLEGVIKPICGTKDDLGATYIVFDSCLYRIGGYDEYKMMSKKSVDYLDLKKMDKVWVPVPEMNNRRLNAYPVILGGQLYVVAGLLNSRKESKDAAVLMEVLKRDGSAWENIPNPPPYPCSPRSKDSIYHSSVFPPSIDNEYFRSLYGPVLVGAVESESKAFIVVVLETNHLRDMSYEVYTYEAEKREWTPYTKIDLSVLSQLQYLPRRPAVVFGQLMLFTGICGMVYVIDLENDKLHQFDEDICEEMTPTIRGLSRDAFLVMIEPGKFGLFWSFFDIGEEVITSLMCSMFTVKRKSILSSLLSLKTNTNTTLCVEHTQKSHWCSLIPPQLCNRTTYSHQRLVDVFLVDRNPDIPKDYGLKTVVESDIAAVSKYEGVKIPASTVLKKKLTCAEAAAVVEATKTMETEAETSPAFIQNTCGYGSSSYMV